MAKYAKIMVGPALAAAFLAMSFVSPRAADASDAAVMVPVKGVSFDVGSKHAVTYYKPAGGICNLTLMLSERQTDDSVPATASRLSVPVLPGKSARIDTAEGKALEFGCKVGAASMTVKTLDQVAWSRTGS